LYPRCGRGFAGSEPLPRSGLQDDRCFVTWDDGSSAELDYASLKIRADNALQVNARDGLQGVIKAPAYYQIVERAQPVESPHAEADADRFTLPAAGQHWPLTALS
jgi:hypothetical protein